jgi:methylated-DNA-[protein]-cysteine S-methyltransferase
MLRSAIVSTKSFGPVLLKASPTHVVSCEFVKNPADARETELPSADDASNRVLLHAVQQVQEFDAGKRMSFDVPVQFVSGTPFQRSVWHELMQIKPGTTKSYKDIAKRVTKPNAFRAVGSACRHNPVVLLVPCHRVVASNGDLTGFGGSSDCSLKSKLLQHEKQHTANDDGESAEQEQKRRRI